MIIIIIMCYAKLRFVVIVLESANNQKLMLEYEKYQELQTRSMRMQEDYEKQIAELDDRSNKAQQELEEHYNRYVSNCAVIPNPN